MDGMPMPLPITLMERALVSAGVAVHAAHVGDEARVLQKGLGDELRAQRVTGHEDGLRQNRLFRRGYEG